MINILTILLTVFGIVFLGYLLSVCKIIKPPLVKALNYFVYYISLPALVISLFSKIEFNQSTLGFLGFHAVLVIILSLALVAILSFFSINTKTKVAIVLGSMVGNTVYMGYPIISFMYPDFPIAVGMGAATIQLIVGLIVAIFLVEYLVLKTKKFSVYIVDIIKNPLIIGIVLGVILIFVPNNQITNKFAYFVSIIGKTASPLALFTLGAFMYRNFSKQSWFLGGVVVVSKLVLFPLAVFFISVLFGYSKELIQISTLISAMPTAVTSFVLAQKYDLNEQLAADIILVSTILSVFSVPIIVWVLG